MHSILITVRQIAAKVQGPVGRSPRYRVVLVGWLLLFAWCAWWADNLIEGRMLFGEHAWFQPPAFGVDYLNGLDKPVRTWMAGGDPYGDVQFNYPPIVIPLFSWINLTRPEIGLGIWICVLALFASAGALAAANARRELGLEALPACLAIALILFSTPVLFALERGNYDLLVVPCVVGAVLLMDRQPKIITADILAGLFIAIAIWAKLYPGLLVFGLLALQRWRVVASLAVFGAVIGLSEISELGQFFENARFVANQYLALARAYPEVIHPWNHPLVLLWPAIWSGTPLARLPGELGAALLLVPLMMWVSWRIYVCPQRHRLALPFLFWVVALGTFVPPLSNDYNLTPLLLGVLAIWNRDDRWSVHLALAILVLWWQPIALPLPGRIVIFIKLAGLFAVAASLVRHASIMKSNSEISPQVVGQ